MMALKLRLFLLVSLFLFAATTANPQTPVAVTQLAVEIQYYPGPSHAEIVVERAEKHWIWFGRFARVPGWVAPANSQPLNAVKITAQQSEEGVRVWVSVLLGKVLEDEKQVTSYILREGDKVTAQELTGVGVVPFELKIVSLAGAVPYVPDFKSKSPAVELASIRPNFSAIPELQLVLRNTSAKPVQAIEVLTISDGVPFLMTMREGNKDEALIPPGGTYEVKIGLKTRYVPNANGFSIETLPNQSIEVATAVFGDGSYEGDSKYAMTFLGYMKGRKTQLARVIELLENSANGNGDLALLKDKLSALSLDADPTAVDELHQQFPPKNQIEPARPSIRVGDAGGVKTVTHVSTDAAKVAIEVGMRRVRDDVLKDLIQFELHSRYSGPNAFNSWLTSAKKQYKAWLSRL
jgi:hypothetical protein